VPQFRVEFIEHADGQFVAELYSPEGGALIGRTETTYPSQASALLAVIQLFKGALAKRRPPSRGRRSPPKAARRRAAPKRRVSARKARKRPKRRSARR
jgi:hypothetical protein